MSKHIVGPGGPHDRNGVVVDTTDAVLLDGWCTAVVHLDEQGAAFALDLSGKVNKQNRRSDVLYMLDGTAAATLVAEIVGTFARNGQGEEFLAMVSTAMPRATGGDQ